MEFGFKVVRLLIKSSANAYHLYYHKDDGGRGELRCKLLAFNRIDNMLAALILMPFVFNEIIGSFCKMTNFVSPFSTRKPTHSPLEYDAEMDLRTPLSSLPRHRL